MEIAKVHRLPPLYAKAESAPSETASTLIESSLRGEKMNIPSPSKWRIHLNRLFFLIAHNLAPEQPEVITTKMTSTSPLGK
jgi:hypothetical protein